MFNRSQSAQARRSSPRSPPAALFAATAVPTDQARLPEDGLLCKQVGGASCGQRSGGERTQGSDVPDSSDRI